jgi:cell division protein FtsB
MSEAETGLGTLKQATKSMAKLQAENRRLKDEIAQLKGTA